MIDRGKHNLLGILVDAVDYEAAVDRVLDAAREHRGAAISALAVHGIMTGVLDPIHRYRLNRFDLIVPDGQPVRWALNLSMAPDWKIACTVLSSRFGFASRQQGSRPRSFFIAARRLVLKACKRIR